MRVRPVFCCVRTMSVAVSSSCLSHQRHRAELLLGAQTLTPSYEARRHDSQVDTITKGCCSLSSSVVVVRVQG